MGDGRFPLWACQPWTFPPITTSTSDELFSRININDFKKTLNFQNKVFFIDFCDLRLLRTLQE